MAIPFKYNRRSLLIRRVSNSMTVGAIAIVVGVFVAGMAIVGGLDSAIKDSSSPDNMMEAGGGASVPDMRIRDGKRQSVFRSYVFPYMDRQNLTVLSHALVTRLTFEGKRVTGVEIFWDGRTHRIRAGREVIMRKPEGFSVTLSPYRKPSLECMDKRVFAVRCLADDQFPILDREPRPA